MGVVALSCVATIGRGTKKVKNHWSTRIPQAGPEKVSTWTSRRSSARIRSPPSASNFEKSAFKYEF